jgi:glycerophosphoryl diester phosphodiesterase
MKKLSKLPPFLLVATLFLLLSACTSFDPSGLKNLNEGKVMRIGHGGMGFASWLPFNALPSNSYSSFSKALLEMSSDGIELDLHMTADGKFILYHDAYLQNKTAEEGCIEERNYEEVRGLAYQLGAPFDWFQSETVLGLEDLMELLLSLERFPVVQMDIRNKSECFTPEENAVWELRMCRKLLQELKAWELPEDKVFIISLSRSFLEEAQRLEYPYILSLEEVGSFEDGLDWVKKHNIDYLTIKPRLLSKEQSAVAHAEKVQIITFGAKSKSGNAKLLELDPDVLQSNNLKALSELLD